MYERELNKMIEAALVAKEKIMEIYNSHSLNVEIKEDNSPVTRADKAADLIIREILKKYFPTYAFLTEESDDDLSRLDSDYVFIVDPVDGTKDFIARDDQFTTNIGLAYKHEVVAGVICIPATGEIYYASKGQGAYYLVNGVSTKIHVNDKTSDLTCLTSVFHLNEEEKKLIEKHHDKITHVEKRGSSIKACHIAHGKAEISYRMSPNTKEWDTSASQIIVIEAGGVFLEPDKSEIKYNRKDVYNRKGYIIANRIENFLV
ncbi:MAG: 3'(2'),5'-bisphosphate nucleotidase CysQ [Bacilli bacterium]